MKELFERKRKLQIVSVNKMADNAPDIVANSERRYESRIRAAADKIISSGCRAVMLSGPSGSGKTTSSLKLAGELRLRGVVSEVISLDDFFKNLKDYPETSDGKKDLESVYAVDIDLVNEKLYELVYSGHAEIPQFDFVKQCRKSETLKMELFDDGVAIIEGIHALNPLLNDAINHSDAFRIYAGLREEYYLGNERIVATRDIRIARRMIRDFYFRGYSIQDTLAIWDNLLAGEETWVKVFKSEADMLLDTSFTYEPCVFKILLEKLLAVPEQGGDRRSELEELAERYADFVAVEEDLIPKRSMLREFIGGLTL